MFNPTRRHLLLGSLAGATSTLLTPWTGGPGAFAQAGPKGRRFIFLYLPGGWDQLLFLDPRAFEFTAADEGAYLAEVERTGIDTAYRFGGYDYATVNDYGEGLHRPNASVDEGFYFGPAAVRFRDGSPMHDVNLVSLVDRGVPMSIIRGINMGTLGHEPGYLYFLTGEPAGGGVARGTSMPIRLASQLVGSEASPTLVPTVALSVGSYTGAADGRLAALKATSVDDLQRILARDEALREPEEVEAALAAYAERPLTEAAKRYDGEGLLSAMSSASAGARAMLTNDLAHTFTFLDGTDDDSAALRQRYGIDDTSKPSGRRSAAAHAAFAALAVKTGFAQFVSAALPAGGDTHGSGNRVHAEGLHGAIDAIARLVDDLATSPADPALGGNWLDHTTICVFSEFARTPRFNATGGRDHHFTNSCLLIGAGLRPGSVVGASTDTGGMAPWPYDFDQRVVLPEGVSPSSPAHRAITPADVGATLLASAGLDYGEYRDGQPLWQAILADR